MILKWYNLIVEWVGGGITPTFLHQETKQQKKMATLPTGLSLERRAYAKG